MFVNFEFSKGEWVNLKLHEGDIEWLREAIALKVVDGIYSKKDLVTLISDSVAERLSKTVFDTINLKINEAVNIFSSNASNIEFRFDTIKTDKKIDAEAYFISKYRTMGVECKKIIGDFRTNCNSCEHAVLKSIVLESDFEGIPDLVVYNRLGFMFIEVKTNNDTLRPSQMRWIKNHPHVKTIVYYLDQTFDVATTIEDAHEPIASV